MEEAEHAPVELPAGLSAAPPLVRPWAAAWNCYIERAAVGDEEALARLYDESSGLVYATALRILRDVADAEEVTLDVYTQIWRTASQFDPRRGSAGTWLIMLARSRALDRMRSMAARKQREAMLEDFGEFRCPAELPDEATVVRQQRERIHTALAALSPEQREAIELAFFSGLSHSELAGRLGQPLGTVKTRIRLGMIKLRQLLGEPAEAQR